MTALEHAAVGSRVLEPKDRSSEGFKPSWTRSYARRLLITDAAAIVGSLGIAQLVRFGADPAPFPSEAVVYSYPPRFSSTDSRLVRCAHGDPGKNAVKVVDSLCASLGRLQAAHLPLSAVANL